MKRKTHEIRLPARMPSGVRSSDSEFEANGYIFILFEPFVGSWWATELYKRNEVEQCEGETAGPSIIRLIESFIGLHWSATNEPFPPGISCLSNFFSRISRNFIVFNLFLFLGTRFVNFNVFSYFPKPYDVFRALLLKSLSSQGHPFSSTVLWQRLNDCSYRRLHSTPPVFSLSLSLLALFYRSLSFGRNDEQASNEYINERKFDNPFSRCFCEATKRRVIQSVAFQATTHVKFRWVLAVFFSIRIILVIVTSRGTFRWCVFVPLSPHRSDRSTLRRARRFDKHFYVGDGTIRKKPGRSEILVKIYRLTRFFNIF